jgi:diguanylate cyclase (GGDEF)-like protein/PAS domain S-box-containing protein
MTGQDKKKVKNEDATMETDNWYKELVDHSHNLIQLVDSDGRFIYVNQAWLSTLKYAAEEASGLTLWKIIHSDSMGQCRAVFKQVITDKATAEVEATLVAKDGTLVVVEGGISAKLDENGCFVHTCGIFSDITERKKTEETLRANEEKLQTTLHSIGDAVIATNTEGLVTGMNPVAENLTGWAEDEARGRPLADVFKIYQAGTMEPACDPVLQVMQTGEVIGLANHTLLISKDCDQYHIADSAAPIRDANGKITGVVLVFRDITEEYLMREALKESEARYRTLVDNVPIGIYRSTPGLEGRFLMANPAFLKIFGITSEEELHELKASDLYINPLERKAFSDQLLKKNKLAKVELKLKKVDGTPIWSSVTAQVVRDENNMMQYFDCALEDITERKQAEEKVVSTNKMLELVMNNIPQFIFWKDRNSVYLGCNKNQAKVAGLNSPEEIVGKTDFDLPWKKEEAEFFRECDQRVMNSGVGEYHIIEQQFQSDGKQAWLDTNKIPLFDLEGNVIGILGTYEDITERKQAEEALIESEEKHREILSAMEEGYYEVDLAGNFVFCNESFCRMSGCNKEELLGESYKRFYIETKRVFETYNQVYKTGKSVKAIDWPALTWDGREAYWELSISLRRDQSGEPVGFRGVIRDITARRQADEKIRYLSYHDQLTGLYNRHFLEEEMRRFDTERQLPISIIMADLNGLKLVNDTYGHNIGDEMLKRAAVILRSVCRQDDLLARFGGDEFVLYLPRTPQNEAQKIVGRIEKACSKEQINDIPLSLATGVAFKVSAEQKLSELLKEAEDNMYRDKLTESLSGKSAIVKSLLQTLAAKSFETEAHTHNMQEAANSIGEKLGLPHSELHRLSLLITLHDIGKINIPEELLTKRGPLEADEWEIMKKHSETGYRIAKATDNFAHVAEDILAHHERWDGSGYPQGLKGEQIPLLSRVTALADAYEVMSNGRPYKEKISVAEIRAEFENCKGKHFDPQLVELFLTVLEEDS